MKIIKGLRVNTSKYYQTSPAQSSGTCLAHGFRRRIALGLNWGVTHLAVKHSNTPHFSTSTGNAQRQDASVNIGSAATCQGCHQAPNKLNAPKTLSHVVPRGKSYVIPKITLQIPQTNTAHLNNMQMRCSVYSAYLLQIGEELNELKVTA